MAWGLKCSDAARARGTVLELATNQVDALQPRVPQSLNLLPHQGVEGLFGREERGRRTRRRQQTGSHVVVRNTVQRIGLRQRRREDAFKDVGESSSTP